MSAQKIPVLILLSLLGSAWPGSITAYSFGVLRAKASIEPTRIEPGGKARISVMVSDGFQQPINSASIKISTASGYFETSNQNLVVGFTDQEGRFQAMWHSNRQTPVGLQTFQVAAVKNGYIGQYPVTATAQVTVGDPSPSGDPARGNPGFPAP